YNNMGLMYYAQYDYPSALKHLKQSLEIDRNIGDRKSAAGAMINIGIIYTYLDSLDKSAQLYQEAYQLYQELGNETGMITALSNAGKVYYAQNDYQNALTSYLKVENYYKDKEINAEALSSI